MSEQPTTSQRIGTWLDSRFQRIFADRELMLRTDGRVWFVKISKNFQVGAFALLMLVGAWGGFSTFNYIIHEQILEAKDNAILDARMTYRSLLAEVSAYQDKFSNLTDDLKENNGLMLGLVERNAALQLNLRTTKSKLKNTEVAREQVDQVRNDLIQRLLGIENQMEKLSGRNFELRGTLSTAETDLQNVLNERNSAVRQGRRMTRQVAGLEKQLAGLQKSEQAILERLIEQTSGNIKSIEVVLAKTGLPAERLLDKYAARPDIGTGQGGPFVAANPTAADQIKVTLARLNTKVSRWDDLRALVRRLPLAPPVDYFKISSRFGKRRDPINKKWAMHYGLDFGGVRKSRIYVTAPGTVTFAGRNGRYGRMIEVTHGNGLKTRYGHLAKILVKKGQKVEYRHRIGLLGSSGRSTGPHLHYEVLFKGRPVDPWKFIKAGNYVYKG